MERWEVWARVAKRGSCLRAYVFVQPDEFPVAQTPAGRGSVAPVSPLILCPALFSPAACKESKRPLEVSQRSEEMGLILGICAGGLGVLILLLGAIIIIIRKG